MKQLVSLLILAASFFEYAYSQSEYLQRGQSSFGAGIGFCSNKDASGWNAQAGYSYYGFLDAGVSYSKANGGKVQNGVFTPRITYYPMKQEDAESIPTIALSIGFTSYTSVEKNVYYVPQDTGALTYRTYEMIEEQKNNVFLLGLCSQRRIGYWSVFFFQPQFGAELGMKQNGWDFTLRMGVAIGTRIVNGPMLILTPGLERRSELTTVLISIGVVM